MPYPTDDEIRRATHGDRAPLCLLALACGLALGVILAAVIAGYFLRGVP